MQSHGRGRGRADGRRARPARQQGDQGHLNAADALGADTEWFRRENVAVSVDDGDLTLEPDIDVVVNRLLLSTSAHPAKDAGLARVFDHVRPVVNRPEAVMTDMHKFATAAALVEADLPVPDALLALSSDRLNAGRERFGGRAVYKTTVGTHGGGTWRVDLEDPANPRVGTRQAFLQRLVETDHTPEDVRVYVVDDAVVAAMYRRAPEGEWRTNVALGGDVADATADLPPEATRIAREAAAAVGLDCAGVTSSRTASRGTCWR
jgi:RimK family alpha-L-glutamate ligase